MARYGLLLLFCEQFCERKLQMATDWEANLRTLIKNTEKDADFLKRGSSWKVRGVRGKTQVTMRLQEVFSSASGRVQVELSYYSSFR